MERGFRFRTFVIVVAIVMLAILAVLSANIVYEPDEPYKPERPQIPQREVSLDILTDKTSYGPDEFVNITIKIINPYTTAVLNFETNHQYDLFIYGPGNNEVFNLFENFSVHDDSTNIIVHPDSEKVILKDYTWNRADKSGRQVPQGDYRIYAKMRGYDISDEEWIEIGEHRELHLKVLTDKNVYREGENVGIYVILVNEMDIDLIFWGGSCGMSDPRIYDSNYEIIFEAWFTCLAVMWNFAMESNSEKEWYNFTWDQTNYTGHFPYEWLSGQSYEHEFTQVPIGLYRIPFTLRASPTTDEDWDPADGEFPSAIDYQIVGFKTILIL